MYEKIVASSSGICSLFLQFKWTDFAVNKFFDDSISVTYLLLLVLMGIKLLKAGLYLAISPDGLYAVAGGRRSCLSQSGSGSV